MSIVLSLRGVHKIFGSAHVLRGVSFDVHEQETHALIGPSGSGKSTLFRILLGYYKPDQGKIFFNGVDVSKDLRKLRKIVGYTTQDDSFYPTLTAVENMQYYAQLYGVRPSKEKICAILKEVGLDLAANRPVTTFSGGMRRRLNFAISLVHNPTILILDEPTTGLDPKLVEQFWQIVDRVKKQGKTIIVTSHILSELETHADRVNILYNGKIAKTIKPKSLLKEFAKTCYPMS